MRVESVTTPSCFGERTIFLIHSVPGVRLAMYHVYLHMYMQRQSHVTHLKVGSSLLIPKRRRYRRCRCALITLRYAAVGDGRVKNPAVMMKTVDCIRIRTSPSLSLLGWGRLAARNLNLPCIIVPR